MKLASCLICGLAFLESFAFGNLNLTGDNSIVGVSQRNLEEYLTRALKGFKNVILKGDKELNYPIMEPYKLEDVSWDWIDASGSNKYSVKFLSTTETIIKRLSKYEIKSASVSASDMRLGFDIVFFSPQIEIPYKLDGYLLKGFMPLYGEGLLKLSASEQQFYVILDLDMEKGFIMVENLYLYRYHDDINVKITGLMDLPDKFANYVLDGILDSPNAEKLIAKALQNIMLDRIEATIGGMTMDELFDYIGHFEKKFDEK